MKKTHTLKTHFHSPVNKSNDAAKVNDYFLKWTKVEFRIIQYWMLVQLQSNIAASGLKNQSHFITK
jgi:hypothetical protein